MELDELHASLSDKRPPQDMTPVLQALWHDAKGEWQRAHELAQSVEGPAGAAVHAYLHRKEGDLENARYWYRLAGLQLPSTTLAQEWEGLAVRFLREGAAP
jgi:hypothetical protein